MATKLSKNVAHSFVPVRASRLRWFSQDKQNFLNQARNPLWRVHARSIKWQLSNLTGEKLIQQVEPDLREVLFEDFYDLLMEKGEAAALEELRSFLCEFTLQAELKPQFHVFRYLQKPLLLIVKKLFHFMSKLQVKTSSKTIAQILKRLRNSKTIKAITRAIHLPQRSPNAPNYAPALSLVAA